jgi:hypothetical protein
VIALATRFRLAPKARLRFDARSGRQMLLYPERGLELSDTAARIVALCQDEPRTAGDIARQLAAEAGEEPGRERIEREVLAFLQALEDRGLLVVATP